MKVRRASTSGPRMWLLRGPLTLQCSEWRDWHGLSAGSERVSGKER